MLLSHHIVCGLQMQAKQVCVMGWGGGWDEMRCDGKEAPCFAWEAERSGVEWSGGEMSEAMSRMRDSEVRK